MVWLRQCIDASDHLGGAIAGAMIAAIEASYCMLRRRAFTDFFGRSGSRLTAEPSSSAAAIEHHDRGGVVRMRRRVAEKGFIHGM